MKLANLCENFGINYENILTGQAVGYIGALAIRALNIYTINPLAAAVSCVAMRTINNFTYACASNIISNLYWCDLLSTPISFVCGAAVYASTSVLSKNDLIAIHLSILLLAVSIKQLQLIVDDKGLK